MKYFKRYVVFPFMILFLLGVQPIALSGCQVVACSGKDTTKVDPLEINFGSKASPVNITLWYLFEKADVVQRVANAYSDIHPTVTVTTRQFSNINDYKTALLQTGGTNDSPDIFVIPHDEVALYQAKLYPITEKNLKREPDSSETVKEYTSLFLPALYDDAVFASEETNTKGEVSTTEFLYGIPMGIEGLALFVNTDHFEEYNRANPTEKLNVPLPTEVMTWNEFAEASQRLIKTRTGWASFDSNGSVSFNRNEVVRYGAGIGYGSSGIESNVPYAPEILTTILYQNGVDIIADDYQTVEFMRGQNAVASVEALTSYSSYSLVWGTTNEGWNNAITQFTEGRVSMAVLPSFKLEGFSVPFSYEVVMFPQRSSDEAEWVTPSYYWLKVVDRNSKNPEIAWDFLKFAASNEQLKEYSESSLMPPARIDLVGEVNLGTTKFNAFIESIPYARSWQKGNPESVDEAISLAINNVSINKKDPQSTLETLYSTIQRILEETHLHYISND